MSTANNETVDPHVLKKYDINKKLGKGVRPVVVVVLARAAVVRSPRTESLRGELPVTTTR
jgi:hypothetical protein